MRVAMHHNDSTPAYAQWKKAPEHEPKDVRIILSIRRRKA